MFITPDEIADEISAIILLKGQRIPLISNSKFQIIP